MVRIDRILLPTDFSDCAARATAFACELADRFGAELYVLHVIHDPLSSAPQFGMGLDFPAFLGSHADRVQRLEEHAIGELTNVLDSQWEQGKRVTLATRQGTPFVEIVRFVKEHGIDLVVMGTHGRGALAHVLMGSVAEKVVRKSPCPVLSIRPDGFRFEPV